MSAPFLSLPPEPGEQTQRNLEAELAAHPIAAELHRDAVQAHVDLVLLIRDFVERHAGLVERRAAAVRRLVAVTREGEAAWMWSVQVRGSEAAEREIARAERPAAAGATDEGEKRAMPSWHPAAGQQLRGLGGDTPPLDGASVVRDEHTPGRAGHGAAGDPWTAASAEGASHETPRAPTFPSRHTDELRAANIRAHDAELERVRAGLKETECDRHAADVERTRLLGVLERIDGGDAPCDDAATLRRWAHEALTLGRFADELSPAGGAR